MNQIDENIPKNYSRFSRYYRQLEPILEKPKTRAYTTVIFSFLAISLFGWYAIRPTIQTILVLRREIADKTIINTQMEQKIANLIEAQAAYQNAADKLPLIDEAVPDSSDPIDITSQISHLVSGTDASFSSIRVTSVPLISEDKKTDSKNSSITFHNFSINMILSGTYSGLEKFISDINSMRRIVSVESIKIAPSTDNSEHILATGKILNLTIQLKSYYKK
jgi:Tfp pilus assembly protein PilO